ncbi:BTAD domain-containing putative transcriptional regulator [Streptomyces sp. NPDC048659]|uniref:AfsR/SARP family transcriptional regulator n=1 Tax=Streptomyces sp. NPDC048659 TaxID=3155489 RepID=UPI00342349E2
MLGPLQVQGAAGPLRVPPGRQEVILAALLLESNRVVSTSQLVDLIWEDNPPETARTQVQICVSRLRKLLAGAQGEVTLVTRPPGYVLHTGEGNVDAALFTSLVQRARALREGREGGDAERAVGLLRSAVTLWQGDCLTGLDSGPLANKARQLNEERLAAVELRIRIELELGRHDRLVGELQRLTHEHPLREKLHGQLIQALYWSGRQAEALEAFRTARRYLAEELGLEPSRELRDLEAAILAGELPPPNGPAQAHPGSTGGTARTGGAGSPSERPGERTGRRPEGQAPAGPSEQPATSSGAPVAPAAETVRQETVPHQLPADIADFVADGQRLDALAKALAGGDGRGTVPLAAITGKPGTGKSTLAVHVAHALAETGFPDGQLYCDLRGTTGAPATPVEVLGRFLRALGIPGQLIPESLDERAEMYRTRLASRRVLVVLDDAAGEGQVLPLLPGSRGCAVLVTSRARLTALPGAHRVELDVLDEDRALELLARIIGQERVAGEAVAAEALVRTVGRLPLALRIVAARLAARPHWTLASMVHRLANERHRLDELAHGEMTMRASLSLTYEGLAPGDRSLLRLLSMAQAPTLPSWLAGALLDDRRPFPSDLLEPLVDVQMLDVAGMETGGFRYRFHEIIRVYAREQLADRHPPEERKAAFARMAGGWMHLAQKAHQKVYGGDFTVLHGDAPRWEPPAAYTDEALADPLAWLDAEQGALCGMVEHAAEEGLHDLSWDLATSLVTLFEVRGHYDLWERTHTIALAAVRKAGNLRGTAAIRASLGSLYMSRNQYDTARQTLTSALDVFQALDEPMGEALCRRDMALIARTGGDDTTALELYGRSLADFDRAGDVVGRAIVLTQSAHIRMRQGETDTAQRQLDEALDIYEGIGYTGGRARTLRRVGQLLLEQGRSDLAVLTFTEVLELCRDSGDAIGEGHLLRDLGHAFTVMGRPDRARDFFDRAVSAREQIMDFSGGALARLDLARLLTEEPGRSRELLTPAVEVFRDRRMARELTEAERLLGAC